MQLKCLVLVMHRANPGEHLHFTNPARNSFLAAMLLETRHTPEVQLDGFPKRDDRDCVFYVAHREDLDRGIHATPPQKIIMCRDYFLSREPHHPVIGMPEYSPPSPIGTHLFDIGFAARTSLSPEKHTNGWSGQEEQRFNLPPLGDFNTTSIGEPRYVSTVASSLTASHVVSPCTAHINTKPLLRWEPNKWPSVASLLMLSSPGGDQT